ncbi:MAG: hypothetical protein NTV46_09490 [Verrucomicrobia bacterium]|nr:hypothetical protein [Verrucomicrobiota bacterium]
MADDNTAHPQAQEEAGLVGMAGVDGAGEGVSRQWLLETVGAMRLTPHT